LFVVFGCLELLWPKPKEAQICLHRKAYWANQV
jgi:hypothetical protein